MRDASGRRLLRSAIITVVVLALLLFLARVDWAQTWQVIRTASPVVLVLAALVNIVSLALKAVRGWLFLRPSTATSLTLALRATFAGASLNNILVANAGEAGRVMLVARSANVPSEKVLATLALERLFEFAGYVVMFLVAVSVVRLPPALDDMRPLAFAAAAALLAALAYLARHGRRMEPPLLARSSVGHRAANYGRGFLRALTDVSTARRFAGAMTLSVVVWALQILTYQLTAHAARFDIPVTGTIACILAVNLGFAIRATPGNVGVFQAIYGVTAAGFGMDADVAVGVALLIQAQQILPITVIGLLAAPDVARISGASPSAAGGA